MKKRLVTLLTLLAVMVFLPLTVQAKTETMKVGKNVKAVYNSSKKTLTIKGKGKMYDYAASPFADKGWNFKKVIVKEKVTSIGDNTFCEYSGKFTIKLPKSLKRIGAFAFSLSGVKNTVTIPKKVTEIGKRAFTGAVKLKAIKVASGNKKFSAKKGVLFSRGKAKIYYYPAGKKGKSYTIPSSVKVISAYAFSGDGALGQAPELKTLRVSKKIKKIEQDAFADSYLKKIYFPGKRPKIINNSLFDSENEMTVKIYYKKSKWAKKYRLNYGAKKVTWKAY